MPMNSELKPKIRFKGFTDDWEQRKLGEIGYAKSGQGFPDAEQGGTKGIPFYKVSDMNIAGNENELITANNYVTLEQINKNHWNIINDVPAIFFAKVGAAVMLNRKRLCRNSFLLDNNTMAYMFDKSKWNYNFGKTLFDTIDLTLLAQIGAIPSYNASDVENIEILMPHLKEQDKIGELFTNLDNLITLHQRKCDKLVELKKSLLEKMFPQNNSVIPEIRFKGFTNDWEQRKLGDECFELIAGGDIDKTRSVNNGKYPIYANALTNDGIVGYYNDSYRVKSPAVTITGRGEIGYAMARNTDFTPVVRLISLRSKHNNYFLANAINLLNVVSESTGVPQLTIPQVEKFDIYFPKNINEEIKLGRLFNEIDNLITLHQCKYDKLNKIRQSLLNDMFI